MAVERDPALIWRPLSEATTQPFITPYQWIVHTAVDSKGPTNLHGYFEQFAINLESHTWLRWNAHEQFIPFNRSADANYKVNRFLKGGKWLGAISTETEDDGNPEGNPWNTYQVNELVRFGVWLARNLGIPPVLPAGPYDPGMGYHSLHPMVWTNVRGKTCPGGTRIRQWRDVVLPRIREELNEGDDDLQADERAWLKKLHDVFANDEPNHPGSDMSRAEVVLDNAMWTGNRVKLAHDAAKKAEEHAAAAALLAGNCNTMLDAIVKHLGIELPAPD